jgi:stage II sporulation protein AB (anti-sigma F factor)
LPGVSVRLELELAAVPEDVPRARAAITDLCARLEIAADVVERVRLAVTEACANSVLHAYDGDSVDPTYMLETSMEGDALLVVVHDCGRGVQRSRNAGLGLGLRLIEELADQTYLSSRPGYGTRTMMRFELRPR